MSVYNHLLLQDSLTGKQINPKVLFEAGPIINVEISVPKALADFYVKQGRPIPQPKAGIALIDTGAKITCVHELIMQNMGVNTIGPVISYTANGAKQCNSFPAHFFFPVARIDVDFASVIEVNLDGQLFNGQQIVALIGRDLLTNAIFVYNGSIGMYTVGI